MKDRAEIRTQDLGDVLDYLAGLERMLAEFAESRRGADGPDSLVDELESMDAYATAWEPLRYQGGVGMGWQYVAENLADLRARLVEAYSDAAL
jgi:hypothetical protein